MEASLKTKVTVKCNYNNGSSSSLPSNRPLSRPTSPSTISINSSLSLPVRRPRAKVNSSVITIRKLSSASSLSVSQKAIESRADSSRATSPSKRPGSSSTSSVVGMAAKARVVVRPSSKSDAIQSRKTRANTYQRSLAVASPDVNPQRSRGRPRGSSVTGHHVPSTSQPVAPVTPDFLASSLSSQLGSDGNGEKPLDHADVRSSISESTEYDYPNTTPVLSLSPAEVTRRPIRTRGYASSELMSSVLSPSSPLPALSKLDGDSYTYGRGTVGRASSTKTRSGRIHHIGAFDNHSLDDKRAGAIAIPVPSYSPPVSALSISSPSSVSRSAISNTAENSGESSISTSVVFSPLKAGRDIELKGLCVSEKRPSLDDLSVGDQASSRDSTLVMHGRSDHWDYVELSPQSSEHKVKAEAKSNHLEITNRSLLAINTSLENTKHRQAKEIRDLRRKLRDSRLSLSPGTFRILNSSPYLNESDHGEDDEGSDNGDKGKSDVLYEKIKMMLEELIESGKKALDTVGGDRGATRVPNAEEKLL